MTNIGDVEPRPVVVPLSLDGSESLTFDAAGHTGRAAYHSPAVNQAGLWVLMRFGPSDSSPIPPIKLRELRVALDRPEALFDSPLFRTIPFSRISAAVNRAVNADRIRPLLPPVNVVMSGDYASGGAAWLLPPPQPVRAARPRLKLTVPADAKRPDSFYATVADVYLAQATLSTRPAVDIAEANAVPASTVHRWLKEARARGLLRLPGVGVTTTDGKKS